MHCTMGARMRGTWVYLSIKTSAAGKGSEKEGKRGATIEIASHELTLVSEDYTTTSEEKDLSNKNTEPQIKHMIKITITLTIGHVPIPQVYHTQTDPRTGLFLHDAQNTTHFGTHARTRLQPLVTLSGVHQPNQKQKKRSHSDKSTSKIYYQNIAFVDLSAGPDNAQDRTIPATINKNYQISTNTNKNIYLYCSCVIS